MKAMIVVPNMLLWPLVVAVWTIDTYLFLAVIRLLFGRFRGSWPARICCSLREVIDPLPRVLGGWLASRRNKPVARWVPWGAVLSAALIARHVLVAIVVSQTRGGA